MRFITSIFMVLCAVCGVISAYFIGHGIVAHGAWPWITAAVLIVAAALFGFVYMRLSKNDPQPVAHGTHVHTHAAGTVHPDPHGPGHH